MSKKNNMGKGMENTEMSNAEIFFNGCNMKMYEPLKKDVQMELFHRYHNGEMELFDVLVNHNIGLLAKIANSISKRYPIEWSEVADYGFEGLRKAVDKYDPEAECSFATFAAKVIVNEVMMSYKKYAPKEIYMNINVSDDEDGENSSCNIVDIYADPDTLEDDALIRDMYKADDKALVERLMSKLTDLQRYVVERHMGMNGYWPMNLQAIADERGCSQQNINKVWFKALEVMRKELKSHNYSV